MPKISTIILSLFFLFSLSSVLAAKKADPLAYDGLSGDFKTQDDWFGNKKKTRKQMEREVEEKQQNAMKEDAEKRHELLENATRDESEKPRYRTKFESKRFGNETETSQDEK